MSQVAVVTDSTASLPADVAEERGLVVVPLQVVVGPDVHDDGTEEVGPERLAQALREFRPVSTSRPAPAVFEQVYADLAARGAREVVSVHLSGEMSGTLESAQLAAGRASIPVHVVDSRQVGIATGFAALAAAEAVAGGVDGEAAAALARRRAEAASSLFYVDTLEYLRRGGRVGAAAALLGGALAVKPLLGLVDGRVATVEKVRTSARALARLEELSVVAAGEETPLDVCVSHLASPERAGALAVRLRERLADRLEGREVWVREVGAAVGAHVGPGTVAVCVSPRVD